MADSSKSDPTSVPTPSRPLLVGAPNIGDRDTFLARVDDIFDRAWLTNDGRYLREFEQRLAEFIGVRHCVVVCNGTIALEIMARACGLTGEVIVPSFTFVATAHALEWIGLTPVFCDVDPVTHNIDSAHVESLITDATSAIMGVHVWGRPCDVDALDLIARSNDLTLIFDAAHALGCSHQGRMIGNFGAAESFSFHATKFFNTLEGGAITTNDDEIAAACRRARNFGFDDPEHVISVGTNGKMNEVCAAMGLTNLDYMPHVIEVNERNYRAYASLLEGTPGVRLIEFDPTERNNYQYVVIEVDESAAGMNRDDLQAALASANISARRYFHPGCHVMEPYASRPQRMALPETERLTHRTLSLPTGTAVDVAAVQSVCGVVRDAVGKAVRG